ncbi:MAG TPA: hypothetical protein VFL90_15150, partial [Methylomirabilota bacterium]|nr:hypothetical protein [Methylomirabilota bacterium]
MIGPTLVRLAVVLACAAAGAALAPSPGLGALIGAMAGVLATTLERGAGAVALPRLVWGTLGALAGLAGGLL